MKLHSRIVGEGSPLLILHGLFGSGDNWQTIAKSYADKGFETHIIDQRNHGRSPHASTHTYSDMVSDLVEYATDRQLSYCSIIGHSMGGKTAMLMSMLQPNLIDKLIICDISPRYYPRHHDHILEALAAVNLASLTSRQEAEDSLLAHGLDIGTRQFLLKNLYRNDNGTFAWRMNLPLLSSQIENIGEALPPHSVYIKNTLFIRGEKSDYITPTDEKIIIQHFPNSSIETIEGAGHWVQAERPIEFFKSSIDFLLS